MNPLQIFPIRIYRFPQTKLFRFLTTLVLTCFVTTTILPNPSYGQSLSPTTGTVLNLPIPGTMVRPSIGFAPPILKGLKIHSENPLRFDFIVDIGDSKIEGEELKKESEKLVKYFLASLTVPENDLWVNLSPYEKDRIIPEKFGQTEMGRDLLAQDYILKQLTASLIYPDEDLGKTFWDRVYKKAYELYGTTNLPINTFNKVWVVPDRAVIYEKEGTAFIVENHLKAMLEGDYLALSKNLDKEEIGTDKLKEDDVKQLSDVSSKIVKEVILPEIEKEVNEGQHFAALRQICNSLVLATWYKQVLKESLLGKVYVDKNKINGVDVEDKQIREKIYEQYIEAYKKGVYDYIKKEDDPYLKELVARRYVSGGANLTVYSDPTILQRVDDVSNLPDAAKVELASEIKEAQESGDIKQLTFDLAEVKGDAAKLLTALQQQKEDKDGVAVNRDKQSTPEFRNGDGKESDIENPQIHRAAFVGLELLVGALAGIVVLFKGIEKLFSKNTKLAQWWLWSPFYRAWESIRDSFGYPGAILRTIFNNESILLSIIPGWKDVNFWTRVKLNFANRRFPQISYEGFVQYKAYIKGEQLDELFEDGELLSSVFLYSTHQIENQRSNSQELWGNVKPCSPERVLDALLALARAKKAGTIDDTMIDKELLIGIAKNKGPFAQTIYESLLQLAEYLKNAPFSFNRTFNQKVLDKDFLKDILLVKGIGDPIGLIVIFLEHHLDEQDLVNKAELFEEFKKFLKFVSGIENWAFFSLFMEAVVDLSERIWSPHERGKGYEKATKLLSLILKGYTVSKFVVPLAIDIDATIFENLKKIGMAGFPIYDLELLTIPFESQESRRVVEFIYASLFQLFYRENNWPYKYNSPITRELLQWIGRETKQYAHHAYSILSALLRKGLINTADDVEEVKRILTIMMQKFEGKTVKKRTFGDVYVQSGRGSTQIIDKKTPFLPIAFEVLGNLVKADGKLKLGEINEFLSALTDPQKENGYEGKCLLAINNWQESVQGESLNPAFLNLKLLTLILKNTNSTGDFEDNLQNVTELLRKAQHENWDQNFVINSLPAFIENTIHDNHFNLDGKVLLVALRYICRDLFSNATTLSQVLQSGKTSIAEELLAELSLSLEIVKQCLYNSSQLGRNHPTALISEFLQEVSRALQNPTAISWGDVTISFLQSHFLSSPTVDEVELYLVPPELVPALNRGQHRRLFENVTTANYQNDEYLAALYLNLIKKVKGRGFLSWEEFVAIVKEGKDSKHTPLVARFIQKHVFHKELKLSEEQQNQIKGLSYDLIHKVLDTFKTSIEKDEITFRELMRFNVEFSKYYLQQNGLENVLELFVLTAATIYGRVIKSEEQKKQFVNILTGLFYSQEYQNLFGQAQMDSERLNEGDLTKVINDLINFADYENLKRQPGDDEIALAVNIRAQLNRGIQTQNAVLLMTSESNSALVEETIDQLAKEENTVVERVVMSGFTKREDLLGRYVPRESMRRGEIESLMATAKENDIKEALKVVLTLKDGEDEESYYTMLQENGNLQNDNLLRWSIATYLKYRENWQEHMKWADGILVKMYDEAKKNPKKKYCLVLDNISAAPAGIRLLFNPILWERVLDMTRHPSRKEPLPLPDNFNFILTMDKETEGQVKDKSFMNRPLVQYVPEMSREDKEKYLKSRIKLNDPTVQRLLAIEEKIKGIHGPKEGEWIIGEKKEAPLVGKLSLAFNDIVEIAKRAAGVSIDSKTPQEELVDEEAYNYLYLQLHNKEEREALRKTIFDNQKVEFDGVKVNREQGVVDFDGVKMGVGEEFMAYARSRPQVSFRELMRDFAGYIATESEERMMCQLARALVYGGKFIQIEGPSGEGKTEIGRVFTKLLGFSLREKTINEETDLSWFSGGMRMTREQRYEVYEADYIHQIEDGRNVFMFNELNTNEDGNLYYYLYPEALGRDEKSLVELTVVDAEGLVRKVKINKNNLWIATVNPENFNARENTPVRVASHIVRFYMAQDIDALQEMIEGLFLREGLKKHLEYVEKLWQIHKELKEKKAGNQISSPQDITPRELISVVEKFGEYVDPMVASVAFRRAVDEVYTYMWKDIQDVDKARGVIDGILGESWGRNSEQVLEASLKEDRRPIMVYTNGANNEGEVKEAIVKVDPQGEVVEVPLSYFHRQKQMVGGFMPAAKPNGYPGGFEKLEELSAPFEEKLGFMAELIKQARLKGDGKLYALCKNYTRLNSRSAPLLNEFFQTGYLEDIEEWVTMKMSDELIKEIQSSGNGLWGHLREEYGIGKIGESIETLTENERLDFARWFYSHRPDNLRFVLVGSSEEETALSVAELNRPLSVNIAEKITENWVGEYLTETLPGDFAQIEDAAQIEKLIRSYTLEAFDLYEQQAKDMKYTHNRLSREDIDTFLGELKEISQRQKLTDEMVKKVAYYTLGIGLLPEYRQRLSFQVQIGNPEEAIEYQNKNGKVYIVIDQLIECETMLKEIPSSENLNGFLVPTNILVEQLSAMAIGLKHGRVVILEGFPGGGKTSSVEDLANRLGLTFNKKLMYEDIDLGEFWGSLSKEGKDFILTALRKDQANRYVLKFLEAYSQGGLYLLDEGGMGFNSQEVISILGRVAKQESIDLGIFHPGLMGQVLKRHMDFHLVIAQNPGRDPILYDVDVAGHKIWVDNVLEVDDAIRIINYHLDNPSAVPEDLKRQIAQIHVDFSQNHPAKEEISPRQLIMVTRSLNDALRNGNNLEKATFEGITVAYLTRVSEHEGKDLWETINQITDYRLEGYHQTLNEPLEIKKKGESNVKEEEINTIEDLPSQNKILKSIHLGMNLDLPIALLVEDGADALDIVRKYANRIGYELRTLWSHAQMTRMHILSSILPKFEKFMDRYGVKREDVTKEFEMALGFLGQYFMPQEEYDKLSETERQDKTRQILFFDTMDIIPERQRILLNDILTTRKMELINERGESVEHILPEWVKIVVSSSVEHQYSSAFINRFLPVRMGAISDIEELKLLVKNRCPLVRAEEVEWINKVARAVHQYDQNRVFGAYYGFSPRDVIKLAMEVQLEKQKAIKGEDRRYFQTNPLYYVLKAMYLVYGLALSEDDYKKYEQDIVQKYFLMELEGGVSAMRAREILDEVGKNIEQELTQESKEDYQITIGLSELSQGEAKVLENGIVIQKRDEEYIIRTQGANIYRIDEEELGTEWRSPSTKSDDLQVKRDGDNLVLKLRLIQSMGGQKLFRDEYNQKRSLPEDEVSTKEFVRYTNEVKKMASALLRSWEVIKNSLGQIRLPRVVLLNGETGRLKTTLMRNFERIWGVPCYILRADEDLRASDLTVGLSFKEGKFEVGVKEFLARVGKINGERIYIPGRSTSNRTILFIDEANSAPEVIHALMPLFRGEKKFNVYYGGETFEVELDNEVMVALAFNPAEKYAGRGTRIAGDKFANFSREVMELADKLYAPDPLKYPKEVLISILSEYHRRGITTTTKQLQDQLGAQEVTSQEGYFEVKPHVTEIEALREPALENLEDILKDKAPVAEKEEAKEQEKTKPPVITQTDRIVYDLPKLQQRVKNFQVAEGYLKFSEDILTDFLLVLANGKADEQLKMDVVEIARNLDLQAGQLIQGIIDLYGGKAIRKSEMLDKIFALRRIFIEHDVVLFCHLKKVKKGSKGVVPYLQLYPEEIKDRLKMTQENIERLGEDAQKYKNQQPQAISVEGSKYKADAGGFFEGEYAFVFELLSSGVYKNVPQKEILNWVGWHELGHVLDNLRLKVRGIKIPRKGKWSALVKMVNKLNRGIWMSENLELNSMLFPVIFSSYAKEYVEHKLIGIVKEHKDKDDYYAQVAKGILNGIILSLKESGDLREDIPELTDAFEDTVIDKMEKVIRKLKSSEINAIGAALYKNLQKYLSTAKKGKYRSKAIRGKGESGIEDILWGVDGTPDVDMEFMDGEGNLEIETPDSDEDAHQPRLIDEGERREGDIEEGDDDGAGQGDIEIPEAVTGDLEALSEITPELVAKFLEIFAGVPRFRKDFSDTGDYLDIERLIAGEDPLYRKKTVQNIAKLRAGITVDLSESVGGSLADNFMQMLTYYTSLFHYSAVRNKNVEFSASGFGNDFVPFLRFKDSRSREIIEQKLADIRARLSREGTRIDNALRGIIKKYKGEPPGNRMEIILTDGSSQGSLTTELELLEQAEKLGIDIVFIGLDTPSVKEYKKYINLDHEPTAEELIQIIMRISLHKVSKKMLPSGNLEAVVGLTREESERTSRRTEPVLADQAALTTLKNSRQQISPPVDGDVGGIHLTPSKFLNLEIRRDAKGVPLPIPMQNMDRLMNVDGFVPIFIKETPLNNLPAFLKISQKDLDAQLSSVR